MNTPKPKPCWLIIFLCLFPCVISGVAAPNNFSPLDVLSAESDEAELQLLAQRFFTAYAAKNFDEWRGFWGAKSQELEGRAKQTSETFARVGVIVIKHFSVTKITLQKDQAVMRVRLEMEAEDSKTGKMAAGFGKSQRTLFCVKEEQQWKVTREIPLARELAEALLMLPDEAARAGFLVAEKEFVNVGLARELYQQGEQFFRNGKLSQSINAYQICRGVADQLGDQLVQGLAWSAIGRAQRSQGEMNAALTSFQQSLQLARVLNQPKGILSNLNNIGSVRAELGNYDEVLSAFNEGLKISETLDEPNNTAVMLNNIANVYLSIGNYAKALEALYRSFEITKKSNNLGRQGIALDSLGAIYLSQGNLELAESSLQQSLALLRKAETNPEASGALTDALINMGHVQKQKGAYEKALEYYQEALHVASTNNEQLKFAAAALSVGEIYYQQKNFAQARKFYEQSLAIKQKQGNHAGQGSVLLLLGRLAYEQSQPEEALRLAEQSTNYARQNGNLDLLWRARSLAGVAHNALGQDVTAQTAFSEAVSSIENIWLQLGGGEQQQQFFFGNKITPYQEIVKLHLKKQEPEVALEFAERAKARTLLDVLYSGHANINHALTAADREQEQQLKNELVAVNALVTRANQTARLDATAQEGLQQRLQHARLAYESFQTKLYAAHPDLRIKRGQSPAFTLAQALPLLPDATSAALEYVTTDDKTFLFALTREGTKPKLQVYELSVATKPLMERAQNFRTKLAQHDLLFGVEAEQLYRDLLGPAQAQLRGKNKLIIVPDGELWALPFEALKSGANRFLLEDFEIARAPSLTALIGMKETHEQRKSDGTNALLALGNPKFQAQGDKNLTLREGGNGLSALPETEAEVKTLAQLYGTRGSKVLVGARASEQEFKAEAGKYRVLHLATHSVFDDVNPMYSHLVMAQPEVATTEDGLLETWEILQMDLHADLVILSACETARGRVHAGEGVWGLVWALFIAGTPTTVVSQWKVNSVSTSELMLAFHRELQTDASAKHASKAEALRQAELKLLRSKQYHHPFYWASFILIGDQR